MPAKILSFDLDGTLIDINFDRFLWYEELPRLYSEQNGVPLEKAREVFLSEYREVGLNRIEWYDLSFWVARLDIRVEPQKLVSDLRHKIAVYPDVLPSLKKLKREGRRMVVFSNTPKMFLQAKIKTDGLDGYFERLISASSEYSKVKCHEGAFKRLAEELGVKTSDILHIGDSFELDYVPALREGCAAVLLERPEIPAERKIMQKGVRKIASLLELEAVL